MGKIANAGMHYPDSPDKDYQIQDWYNHPWDAVFRPKDEKLAKLVANMAIAAANNNNIIYIWGGTSYHKELEKANYDPAAIQVQCGTDCMGTCFANIKGAMKRLGMDPTGIPDMGTMNADVLMDHGFTRFTDSDHVATDAHSTRGDVYVNYNQHACMHVGNGNLQDYSGSSGGDSSGGTNINLDAISPYVIGIPESARTFKGDVFLKSQVCGVALNAGCLYIEGTHQEKARYIAPHLLEQVECAEKYGLPYALIAEVRAKSVAEAKKECDKLYYVCASSIPAMGLWLHLDFNNSKSVNERILDYYVETCSIWGFKNSLGVYVTKKELERITWSKYSDDLYLWRVDHSLDVDDYVGVLPFGTYVEGGSSSGEGSTGGGNVGSGGQEYDQANAKQKAIVDACKTTPSPGANLCAAWITYVYMNAGAGHPTGNACDMYYAYCKYSDRSQLKVGMLVAVPSYAGNAAGETYGHVAIYIGDGQVMDNIGYINTQSLDSWIAYYGNTHTVKWGFGGSNIA